MSTTPPASTVTALSLLAMYRQDEIWTTVTGLQLQYKSIVNSPVFATYIANLMPLAFRIARDSVDTMN